MSCVSQLERNQERSLNNLMKDSRKKFFLSAMANTEFISANKFANSIYTQWTNHGYLSFKQVKAFINAAQSYEHRHRMQIEGIPTYTRGEQILLDPIMISSIEEIEVPSRFTRAGTITTKLVKAKKDGITYLLKTNSQKLLKVFEESIQAQAPLVIFAAVNKGNEFTPFVHLSSRAMRAMSA